MMAPCGGPWPTWARWASVSTPHSMPGAPPTFHSKKTLTAQPLLTHEPSELVRCHQRARPPDRRAVPVFQRRVDDEPPDPTHGPFDDCLVDDRRTGPRQRIDGIRTCAAERHRARQRQADREK